MTCGGHFSREARPLKVAKIASWGGDPKTSEDNIITGSDYDSWHDCQTNIYRIFWEGKRHKKGFYRARYISSHDLHPKDAHSRISDLWGSFLARGATP